MADCFLKVRAHTESNPVYQKANLLLKALDQTLPNKSPTFYYAAVLDMLQNPEELVHQEASVLLLACSLQAVPIALIQKEFQTIKLSVLSLLRKDSETLAKYSVKVLERLLQVITKQEWEEWSDKTKVLQTMLELVVDTHEYARIQSCSSLIRLLRKGLVNVPKVTEYVTSNFMDLIEMQTKHVKAETVVNALGFLTAYLQLIPLRDVYQMTDKILALCLQNMSLQVTTKAYLALEALFAGLNLPRDVISGYLTNLLSAPVLAGGSEELQVSYIQALTQALNYFNRADSNECYKQLARGISTISEFLLSNQFNVQHAACSSLTSVILRCISPAHAEELDPAQDLALSFDVLNIEEQGVKPIQKINAIMVYLLNERFSDILEIIFPVLSVYVQQLGKKSAHILQRLVIELDIIAIKWHSNEKYQKLIATIINTLGCQQFFSILPFRPHLISLESQNFLEHSRSWILLVLISHAIQGDLVYFFNEIFPIGEQLEKLHGECTAQGLMNSANQYSILITQIWKAFPAFCNLSIWTFEQKEILKQKLPLLSKIMGKSNDIKANVIIGLKKTMSKETLPIFTMVEDKFVPILFTNYLAQPEKSILVLLKEYPISPQYAEKMCKRLIQKVLESKQANKASEASLLMDLLVRVCSKLTSLEQNDKEILVKFITAYIESNDWKLQKKAYRILKSLAPIDTPLVESLLLTGEIKICSETARKDRLKVYHELFTGYPSEKQLLLLNKYLMEILHCMKSQSHKTRELCKSYTLELAIDLYSNSLFMNLWNCILGGLASNIDSTKSTTIDMLKLLTKNFSFGSEHQMYTSELEQDNGLFSIATVIVLLLKDPSKEVARSALKYIKAVIPLLSESSAYSLAPKIFDPIFANKEEIEGSMRNYVKFILEKLIRKCSYEKLEKIFPEEHKKLLHYIYRESKKVKGKKKESAKVEDEGEMEVDLDAEYVRRKQKNAEKQQPLPREYHFMNPLDLPATQKVKKSQEKAQEFALQDDKFVINEDSDDGSSSSDSDEGPVKKAKFTEKDTVKSKKLDKSKPFAYVQYSADIVNKRKAAKTAGKLNKVVDKAKLGVLKGLKARKKKFS